MDRVCRIMMLLLMILVAGAFLPEATFASHSNHDPDDLMSPRCARCDAVIAVGEHLCPACQALETNQNTARRAREERDAKALQEHLDRARREAESASSAGKSANGKRAQEKAEMDRLAREQIEQMKAEMGRARKREEQREREAARAEALARLNASLSNASDAGFGARNPADSYAGALRDTEAQIQSMKYLNVEKLSGLPSAFIRLNKMIKRAEGVADRVLGWERRGYHVPINSQTSIAERNAKLAADEITQRGVDLIHRSGEEIEKILAAPSKSGERRTLNGGPGQAGFFRSFFTPATGAKRDERGAEDLLNRFDEH